jgi:hypothetical protein
MVTHMFTSSKVVVWVLRGVTSSQTTKIDFEGGLQRRRRSVL